MFDRANPSNPSGPLWDLGPSVLFWGISPWISSRALLACIKISYTRYVIHFFLLLGLYARFQGIKYAGAETRSTGTRRSLLWGRGAHPATAVRWG